MQASRWLTVIALFVSLCGCDLAKSPVNMFSSPKTFHRKFGLRAENYFADPQVLQLCEAIEQDDVTAMRRLIEAGADVKAEGKSGVTPLFWAFPDNKIERFRLLLEKGADPSVRLMSDLGVPSAFTPGDTVMHLSARSHFPEHFAEVMKHGGDANLRGRHGDCVIHELIMGGVPNAEERIRIAVKYGADVNSLDHLGRTPITLACGWFMQFQLASLLLESGGDPAIRERWASHRATFGARI